MRGIIIGAGRGQRLMPTTADAPKCYAEVGGRRILDWTRDAFHQNGITDLCFIGGYRIEMVRRDYPDFTFRHNTDWPNNNIMMSLMHAADLMDEEFVCCYSDCLFTPALIRGLLDTPGGIVVSLDLEWLDRYAERSLHPPDDAEKAVVKYGQLTGIHRDIPTNEAYGEYTGVAKFSERGAQQLREHFERRKAEYAGKPFREAKVFEKAYLIHLLDDLIEQGTEIRHADSRAEYIEIDTQEDYDYAGRNWPLHK
ncbi:MAG: sugar phosphate nucleotidyltransferase [Candidatus Sumerlaeaceae bacterium]